MKRATLCVALALALGACAGPRADLEVGSKEVAVDIVLGAQTTPPALPPDLTPNPGFPGFIQPPLPRPDPGAPPPVGPPQGACPTPHPLDPIARAAARTAPYAPAAGSYVYRNVGEFTLDGQTIEYPRTMTRRVHEVRAIEGGFEFAVDATFAGVTTTTRYRALNAGLTPDRGLYITQVVTRRPEGTETFTPDPPILLLPFVSPEYGTNLEDEIDRARGDGYRSQGTDPLTQTTMTLEARIDAKQRINACGEWVDAFDVVVTTGSIVGPTKRLDFSGHYLVAPQYGGLIVSDDITMSGTEDVVEPVSSRVRSTINSVPRDPPDAPSV